MATVIDSLLITLGVDPSGVQAGMARAESRISSGIRNIMSSFAPLAGAAGIGTIVSNYVSSASELKNLSGLLQTSMGDLQAWQGATVAAGGSADSLSEAFIDMNEYLVDAVRFDSGPLVDVLSRLGLSATDAAGNIKSASDMYLELAEAGEKVGSQEMLALGKIMGLDSGMIMLLQKGKSGIEDMLKAQKELGAYTEKDAEVASEAKISMTNLIKVLESLAAMVLRVIVPALTFVTNALTKMVLFMRQNEPFMLAFFGGIAAVITAKMIPAMWVLAKAALTNPMVWIFMLIAGAIALVALIIDDLWAAFTGGESVLLNLWNAFTSFIDGIIAGISKAWQSLGDFFTGIFGDIISFIVNIATNIDTFLSNVTGKFYATGRGIRDFFTGIFDGIKSFFDMIIGKISAGLKYVTDLIPSVDGITEGASDLWESAKGGFGFFGGNDEAVEAIADSSSNSSNVQNETSVNVGTVNIQTQATDSQGIATGISSAIGNEMPKNIVMASNTGVIQK